MDYFKKLALAGAMTLALIAAAGPGNAGATTLQSGGKNLPSGTEIWSTLKPATSSLIRDTFGFGVQTCTQSENKVRTSNETGTAVSGPIIIQSTGSCTNPVFVHNNGEMKIEWTSGNNGKVIASGSETTFFSAVLGAYCLAKTSNTTVGTLTGSTSGSATIDINGVINAGPCGDFVWTASYTVTSPSPLAVVN